MANAHLPKPVTPSHEMHLYGARRMLLPRLLILALTLENFLDTLSALNRLLRGFFEQRHGINSSVGGLGMNIIVCLPIHLLLVESTQDYS